MALGQGMTQNYDEHNFEDLGRKTMFEKMQGNVSNKLNTIGVKRTVKNYAINYVKDRFTIEFSCNDSFGEYLYLSAWLYSLDKDKYLRNSYYPASKKFFLEKRTSSFQNYNKLRAKMTPYILKISKDGWIKVSTQEKFSGCYYVELKIIFFGKDAHRNLNRFEKFSHKFKLKRGTKMITMFEDSSSRNRNQYGGYNGPSQKFILRRELDTLFYEEDVQTEIFSYIKSWMRRKQLFESRGIPHKTGFLLFGDPGTGKTNIAKTVASKFGMNIIKPDMTDIAASYNRLLMNAGVSNSVSDYHIVLLEDFDLIFGDKNDELNMNEKANINNLMQFLDGSDSPSNAIIIATTNHIEKFKENKERANIIRSGRFDVKKYIGNLCKEKAIEMIHSFDSETEGDYKLHIDYILEKSIADGAERELIYNQSKLQSEIVKDIFRQDVGKAFSEEEVVLDGEL